MLQENPHFGKWFLVLKRFTFRFIVVCHTMYAECFEFLAAVAVVVVAIDCQVLFENVLTFVSS